MERALIEFGWLTPDALLLSKYEKLWGEWFPYDGIAFNLNCDNCSGIYGRVMQGLNFSKVTGVVDLPELNFQSLVKECITIYHYPWYGLELSANEMNEQFKTIIEKFRRLKLKTFNNDLLYVSLSSGHEEKDKKFWFWKSNKESGIWENTLHTMGLLATLAKELKCKGLILDTEQYHLKEYPGTWIFSYSEMMQALVNKIVSNDISIEDFCAQSDELPLKIPRSLAEKYGEKVPECIVTNSDYDAWNRFRMLIRSRATEMMLEMEKNFCGEDKLCGIEILLTYGNSIYEGDTDEQPDQNPNTLYQHAYSLLAPFVDGLISGAKKERSVITDGCEGYYTKRKYIPEKGHLHCFDNKAQNLMYKVKYEFSKYSTIPETYSQNIRIGFGMFKDLTKSGQYNLELAQHSIKLESALKYTDKYVWFWHERTTPWYFDSIGISSINLWNSNRSWPTKGDDPHVCKNENPPTNKMELLGYADAQALPVSFLIDQHFRKNFWASGSVHSKFLLPYQCKESVEFPVPINFVGIVCIRVAANQQAVFVVGCDKFGLIPEDTSSVTEVNEFVTRVGQNGFVTKLGQSNALGKDFQLKYAAKDDNGFCYWKFTDINHINPVGDLYSQFMRVSFLGLNNNINIMGDEREREPMFVKCFKLNYEVKDGLGYSDAWRIDYSFVGIMCVRIGANQQQVFAAGWDGHGDYDNNNQQNGFHKGLGYSKSIGGEFSLQNKGTDGNSTLWQFVKFKPPNSDTTGQMHITLIGSFD